MIPQTNDILDIDFEIEKDPSLVHRALIEAGEKEIIGLTDGLRAVKQAIYMILMTERYQHVIYSWDYGVELLSLYGKPVTYACPEIERRIREALLMDDRILEAYDFTFDLKSKDHQVIHTTFKVRTIYGELEEEKEVRIR